MVQTDRHTSDSCSTTTLTPTDSDIMKAIGDWLSQTLLSPSWRIIAGQQNRIAPPTGPFIVMQIISRRALATTQHHYENETLIISQPYEISLQITAYGAKAGDEISRISTLWRDELTTQWFSQKSTRIAPISNSYPLQHAFTTAEQQYEDTWSITLKAALSMQLTTTSSTALELGLSSITEAEQIPSKTAL